MSKMVTNTFTHIPAHICVEKGPRIGPMQYVAL